MPVLNILRDVGIKVDSKIARKLLHEAGADIDDDTARVRFDPGMVEDMLIGIPSEFTIHARNPDKTLTVGKNAMIFATVCGPSFVSDIDQGRRQGTREDMRNFVKLAGMLNIFHHEGGSGCEPMDLPPETRHLDMMLAQTTLTDKGWQPCWLNSAERARDCIEMAKIALQTDDEGLRE
jgi:trimethylamine--corrinoid protein Co-methyltransferase